MFVKRILENREAVRDFIQQAKHNGEKIYGYGASTKGNTILQFFDLGAYLDGIGDRNQEKIGKLTVGTHIPIVSEEEARLKADYFLILRLVMPKQILKPYHSFFVQSKASALQMSEITFPRLWLFQHNIVFFPPQVLPRFALIDCGEKDLPPCLQ